MGVFSAKGFNMLRTLTLTSFALLMALAGCMGSSAPEMSAADQAALEKAKAELVAAECKLYEGTGITPEGC